MKPDKLVEKIGEYLESSDGCILSIKGASGVGKTYFIRKYFEGTQSVELYNLDNFSSISSLEERFNVFKEIIEDNVKGSNSIKNKIFVFDNVDGFINGCKINNNAESEIIRFFALLRELNKNNRVIYLVDESKFESVVYDQYKEKYVKNQYRLESHKEKVIGDILVSKQANAIEILDALSDINEEDLRYIISGTDKFLEIYNNNIVYEVIKDNANAVKLLYKNIMFIVIESVRNNVYLIDYIKNSKYIDTTDLLKDEYKKNDASVHDSRESDSAKLRAKNLNDIKKIHGKYVNTPIIASEFVKNYLTNDFEINEVYLKNYIDLIVLATEKIDLAMKLNEASNVDIFYMLDEDYDELLKKWNIIFNNTTLNFEHLLTIENLLLAFPSESELYAETLSNIEKIYEERYLELFENQRLTEQANNLIYFANVYRFNYNAYFDMKLELEAKKDRISKYNDLYRKYFNEKFLENLEITQLHELLKELAFTARRDFFGSDIEIFTDTVNGYVNKILNKGDYKKIHYETINMLDTELVTVKIQDDYFKELLEKTKNLEVPEQHEKAFSWIVSNIDKWRAERVRRIEEKNRR